MRSHKKAILLFLVCFLAFTSSAQDLKKIDVSGRDGQNGRDGENQSGSASTNSDGRDGGDAGPAEPGQKSGNIAIELKSGPAGTLTLQGTFNPASAGTQNVRENIKIGKTGYIPLRANGGHGGAGGDGGNGEHGGHGSSGSDATQYSSGGDGHRGGNGGNGGNATSGKDGGAGGKIHVRVSGDDTHLVMLVEPQIKGGSGGHAGKNGSGGGGGSGGSGGSSYSWTESYTTSGTDSDGNSTTETHTTYHSNPGGSSGSSGSSGSDGSARVTSGSDAPDGEFKIIVNDGGGKTREFQRRYNMEIVGFDMVEDNGDKINEPGEKATIKNLRVKNTGGMPTPPNHPVKVFLGKSEWVLPEGVVLDIPKSLAPGESYTFEKEILPFKISDTGVISQDKPFQAEDSARPLASQSGVDRPYTEFDKPHHFEIQFPIRVEPVTGIETLAPGDATKMHWNITNISDHDFGGTSELKREIATVLGMGNAAEQKGNIVLMDAKGNPLSWDSGLLEAVAKLKAGKSTTLSGMVGILPTAPSYSSADMQVELQLGKIDEPGSRRVIQKNTYPIRIGEKYRKTPGSDILLVTNHGTTQEEIKAWRDLAKKSGKTLDVWDISLNDYLDLDRSLGKGDRLLEDFHGKTIVLLNNKFKTIEGQKHGDELMGQMDLIRATASHGIRLLVVNDENHDVERLMSDRLIPTDGEIEHGYKNLKTYLKGEPDASSEKGSALMLNDQFKPEITDAEAKKKEVKANPTDSTAQISMDGIRKPNAKRLAKQAAAAQRKIEARNPGSRVVVSYAMPEPGDAGPEYRKKTGLFGRQTKHQGILTVRPTVNDTQPNIIVINVPAKDMHSATLISGTGVTGALTQAFNFEDKLSALDTILSEMNDLKEGTPGYTERHELGKRLVDALLIDLSVEQGAILKNGWKKGVSADTLRKSMAYLNRLGNYQTKLDLSKPTAAADLMVDLVAGLQFIGKNEARWYESLPFPWAFFRRGPVLRKHTLAMATKLQTEMFGPASTHGDELKKQFTDRLAELMKRRNEVYAGSKKTYGQQFSLKRSATQSQLDPLVQENVSMDALFTFGRVLSDEDWQDIHAKETALENGRRELQAAKEQQKGDFLVVSGGKATSAANRDCAGHFLRISEEASKQKP